MRAWITGPVVYAMAGAGYLLMIPTVAYPIYFRFHVAAGNNLADAIWAGMVAASLVLAGILGPILGAYADQTRSRRKLILVSTCLASDSSCMPCLISPSNRSLSFAALLCDRHTIHHWIWLARQSLSERNAIYVTIAIWLALLVFMATGTHKSAPIIIAALPRPLCQHHTR